MSVTWRLLVGDCRATLATLPAGSVQTVVTSPPYWGLRDYGLAPIVFGGDAACPHDFTPSAPRHKGGPHGNGVMLDGGRAVVDAQAAVKDQPTGATCARCGAWAGQLGLEPTPEQYVAHLVEVFRAVHRVLRDDGTLWLNLGDCYASAPPGNTKTGVEKWASSGLHGAVSANYAETLDASVSKRQSTLVDGLAPKNLVGQPWRVAFALQADGWILRSDIIWAKPNPMPESVTDRPTKAHEYLFLLAKSERYFYDAAAIREPASGTAHARGAGVNPKAAAAPSGWDTGPGDHHGKTGRYKTATTPHRNGRRQAPEPGQPHAFSAMPRPKQNASFSAAVSGLVDARNKRDVWTIPTEPYAGAHFATFPRAIVAPCVLAGSRPGDTVLDPFVGSGTVLAVATDHGRHAIGCELSPAYAALARQRMADHNPLLAQEVSA